jgi:hypothetical protein
MEIINTRKVFMYKKLIALVALCMVTGNKSECSGYSSSSSSSSSSSARAYNHDIGTEAPPPRQPSWTTSNTTSSSSASTPPAAVVGVPVAGAGGSDGYPSAPPAAAAGSSSSSSSPWPKGTTAAAGAYNHLRPAAGGAGVGGTTTGGHDSDDDTGSAAAAAGSSSSSSSFARERSAYSGGVSAAAAAAAAASGATDQRDRKHRQADLQQQQGKSRQAAQSKAKLIAGTVERQMEYLKGKPLYNCFEGLNRRILAGGNQLMFSDRRRDLLLALTVLDSSLRPVQLQRTGLEYSTNQQTFLEDYDSDEEALKDCGNIEAAVAQRRKEVEARLKEKRDGQAKSGAAAASASGLLSWLSSGAKPVSRQQSQFTPAAASANEQGSSSYQHTQTADSNAQAAAAAAANSTGLLSWLTSGAKPASRKQSQYTASAAGADQQGSSSYQRT